MNTWHNAWSKARVGKSWIWWNVCLFAASSDSLFLLCLMSHFTENHSRLGHPVSCLRRSPISLTCKLIKSISFCVSVCLFLVHVLLCSYLSSYGPSCLIQINEWKSEWIIDFPVSGFKRTLIWGCLIRDCYTVLVIVIVFPYFRLLYISQSFHLYSHT